MGAKVVTASDSNGWVYDPEGIDVAALKEIKEVKRERLTSYKSYRPNSEYHEGRGVWTVKVDIALPCATQNELHLEDAKALAAMLSQGQSQASLKQIAESAAKGDTAQLGQLIQSVAGSPGGAELLRRLNESFGQKK